MKNFILTLCLFLSATITFAQEIEDLKFTDVYDVKTTSVKDQQSTGTCWAFATVSFIETELLRMGAGEFDLSEMFIVRNAYTTKAKKYFRLHAKGNFSEGGQAHDVLNEVVKHGFVPENVYLGKKYNRDIHIHREMVKSTKAMLDQIIKNPNKEITPVWETSVNCVFDTYMGSLPKTFEYKSKEYTPKSLLAETKFDPSQYIEITSYNTYDFYKQINLEIPDNWSNDLYYNVPMNDLMEIINHALKNGYSVCWDGDVSEKGFMYKSGIAILPIKKSVDMSNSEINKWVDSKSKKKSKKQIGIKEIEVDENLRQLTFDNYKTTDDHLMHITGLVKDQNGKLYYKTKNSWAADSNNSGGYLNMSEAYVKLKTVAIMIHKDALSSKMKSKLQLK